ncbi:MAG: hypothetical protein E7593_05845 [Ruminococcaceae bacterium]|nr:hypothetical protein [Oscillospiraceae bacterium]
MKVKLSINGHKKELTYPENVVWIEYISHSRGITVSIGFDLFFDNVTKAEEKLSFPDEAESNLLIYHTEDMDLRNLISKYKGLRILEVSHNGIEIIATV